MAKKKVEKKKLEKAERKKLQKLVGEMMMPMFEKYQGEVRIYATKNGVIATPSENDADYPEMPESLALTGISKFLGIKNTIEVAQVTIDDKKLWVSRSLCPHLYVKSEEKSSDEKVDVDFSHIGEKDPEQDVTDEKDGEDTDSTPDDNIHPQQPSTPSTTRKKYGERWTSFDGDILNMDMDTDEPKTKKLSGPASEFYNIVNPWGRPEKDQILSFIEFVLKYIGDDRPIGIKELSSMLSVDNARMLRIFRRDKYVAPEHYQDAKYLFVNLLKVLKDKNEPIYSAIVDRVLRVHFDGNWVTSFQLNLVASRDYGASLNYSKIRSLMNEKHGYPFNESQCYKLLTSCINRSNSSYPADMDRFFPRLIKVLRMYGDASELTDEYEVSEENRESVFNTFEKILRGFKKCEYYDEIIAMFSDYIRENGELHLFSPPTYPWLVIKEKDFNAMVGRINNEGAKS